MERTNVLVCLVFSLWATGQVLGQEDLLAMESEGAIQIVEAPADLQVMERLESIRAVEAPAPDLLAMESQSSIRSVEAPSYTVDLQSEHRVGPAGAIQYPRPNVKRKFKVHVNRQ